MQSAVGRSCRASPDFLPGSAGIPETARSAPSNNRAGRRRSPPFCPRRCAEAFRTHCARPAERGHSRTRATSMPIGNTRGLYSPFADDDRPVGLDRPAQFALDIMVEALQPFRRLEADQIISKHRADQPLVIGQRHHQPVRRPRDVKEESDSVGDIMLAQPLAERDQMVIMDPDADRRVRSAARPSRRSGR